MVRAIAVAAALSSIHAGAQVMRDSVHPDIGSPAVASVGETVYEKSHLSVLPAYTIDEFFTGKNIFAVVTLSPGDKFVRIDSKATLKGVYPLRIRNA